MDINRNIVLVTGASSGLGSAVSNYLYRKGFTVYAAARSFRAESKECDADESRGCLHRVYLDVTDQASVDRLFEQINLEEGRLDVLINCAAHLVLGAVEETSIEEYRGVLETNFLGTVRMCRSALPMMREQKNGLIINFSSINGVVGIPFQSAYVASKFAIEGLTESLSLEVKDFGIDVVMIEPSDHRSGSKNYRRHAKSADYAGSPYYRDFVKVAEKIEYDEMNGSDPGKLADLIYRITLKPRPMLRYRIGKFDQRLSITLKRLLPGRIFERIVNGYYKG